MIVIAQKTILTLILWFCLGLIASGTANKIKIAASIPPVQFLVDGIGHDLISSFSFVPVGTEPEFFEPSPKDVVRLTSSQIYFSLGLPFEKKLKNHITGITKGLKMVDASRGIERLGTTCQHDHAGEHSVHHTHGISDPHVWTSPKNIAIISKNILNSLIQLRPDKKKFFEDNYTKLMRRLEQLALRTKKLLSPYSSKGVWFVHGAWHYLLKQYNIKQYSFEIETKEPSPRQLVRMMNRAKSQNISSIFVQPQFRRQMALIFKKELNVNLIELDPNSYELLQNIEIAAQKISQSLMKVSK
jgi:zinc transport system substrate-binding protein